jgi:hypothetical protein
MELKLGAFHEVKRKVQDHSPLSAIEPKGMISMFKHAFRYTDQLPFARDYVMNFLKREVNRDQFESYLKFAFIRNPYARTHSWYRHVIRDEVLRKKKGVSDDCSFDQFLERHGHDWALRPQVFWLKDLSGKINMDYIGRFENLLQDFETVADKIGLENPELEHTMKSPSTDWQAEYSDFSRSWVEKHQKEDLELLNYTFE